MVDKKKPEKKRRPKPKGQSSRKTVKKSVSKSTGKISSLEKTGGRLSVKNNKRTHKERVAADSEARFRDFFNYSPVSLWEEDISGLRVHFADLRSKGITDLGAYFERHPEEVIKCTELVRVVAVNNATLDLYEAPDQDTLIKGLSQVFTAQSIDAFRDIVLAFSDEVQIQECETVNKTLTGKTINVILKWSIIDSDGGNRSRVLLSVVDITGRRNVEESLQRSQENLKRAEKIARIGNWEWNIQTNEVLWSDEVFKIYGMDPSRQRPSYDIIVETIVPECRERFVNAIERAVKEGEHFEGEYRMIGLDGGERFSHITGEVIRDQDGRPVSMFGIVQDVTERKQAEAALRESEKRLRTLIDAIPDAVFFKDLEGHHIIDNKANEEIFGISPEMLAGKTADDFVPPEIAAVCRKNDEEVVKNGRIVRCEEISKDKSGNKQVLDTIRVPLYDDDGNAMGLVGIVRDITQQKLAEQRLRESEDRFRTVFECATDGIMIADIEQKRHIEANMAICAMLGYAHDELINLHVEDIHPKEALPRVLDLFERQASGEASMGLDVPMLRKDGSVLYVDVNAARVPLGGKEYLVGIFRDITERKKAEEALKKREKQLAESQRIAHIGSWEHNLQTGEVFWSDELFRLLGLDPEKDPGDFKMFFQMIHPDDQPMLKAAIDETVKNKTPFSVDYRFNFRDGRTGIIHAQAELIADDKGDFVVLSGTAQDITESKNIEEKIRKSEQFIRSILDTVDEGFIVVDRDYRIVTANKAYCDQVGCASDNVIGMHCYMISHRNNVPCYEEGEECAVRYAFETGEPHSALHKHPDNGHMLYVETKAYPLKDQSGNVTSVIETINNITEKHLLEEERLKTQKLESIGTLAGGIAHDFNNLLQGIFGYISMARMSIDNSERSLSMLEQAEQALHQSVNLTTQLLTFSKGGQPVMKVTDLRPVIGNATAFAMSGSRSDHSVTMDADLWNVLADDGQIAQVIQNIVLNASQAMPIGGRVVVSVRNVQAGDPRLPTSLKRRDYVAIQVNDRGGGIPERYIDKIFDPYFTTKEKGSGLGLATSYSIVKKHGGTITVDSRSDSGSSFTIYLPAAKEEAVVQTAPIRQTPPGMAKVLVMDDEEIVRNVAAELLDALGYESELAEHGDAALTKYSEAFKASRPFDIVILDLTIRGGMGGVETVKKLLEIDPNVKAVVSSGYSDDAAVAQYNVHGFKAFLKKPYNFEQLRELLYVLL